MSSAFDQARPCRPVVVSGSIDASVSDLWEAISTPGNLEQAHPYCARNPVVRWPGPGSCDEVHYLCGWVYRREFTDWADGNGYDLTIGAEGEQSSKVSWRIATTAPGGSTLSIAIWPRTVMGSVPPWLERSAQRAYVRPLLRRYLRSVVQGFDWYLATGRPVSDNQFGRHPWFSGR